jgi:hypothetical protein
VRSHAKASTAGSTKRQGKSLGRIFRGADAGRGASLEAKGTGAPKSRLLGLPLALLVAVFSLILGVGSASAVAPTIVSTSASSVTTKAALLEAQINPEGEATSYRFEYGLADCSTNPCTSTPVGNVGAGSSAVKVSKEIAGLSPGTTYHFRVIADNGSGPAEGPDRIFKTYAAATPDTSCPNQAFRYGPGAFLPDCRAYEMVSPVEKNGDDIHAGEGGDIRAAYNQAALDGNKLTYSNYTPFGDIKSARGSNQYIATRGADGWSSHGINAPLGATFSNQPYAGTNFLYDLNTQFQMFTPDLSRAWLVDHNRTPLTPDGGDAPNLYQRDNLGESYEALTIATPSPAAPIVLEQYYPEVQGTSSDFSKAVFAARGKLTPDAAENESDQVYMYSGGELHLVSVLPDGTADPGESNAGTVNKLSPEDSSFNHAVSDDGSRVFWTSGEAGLGSVYVRINPDQEQSALNGSNECTEPAKACTVQVAAFSRFLAAAADGSKVLTEGSLFDVDTETATPIAGEMGLIGASDDLSYIYFTSKEVLDAGATAGEPNIYVYHAGDIGFIATIAAVESGLKGAGAGDNIPSVDSSKSLYHASRVTPDGRHLAFESYADLTGYDNTDSVTGLPSMEVYLYEVDAGELICASCNPSGARPVAKPLQVPYSTDPDQPAGPPGLPPFRAAAWLQTAIHPLHPSRALSDDGGRLYFNAYDALVPEDTNGVQDVYQWEAEGKGSCDRSEGCVSLISTGSSANKSEFIDASEDGRDVFIETASSIDPRDPGLIDIYDVRIGGGQQLPPPPPSPCVGDACQSIPAAPNDPTPASAAFKGAGDPTPRKARRSCKARSRHAGKAKGHAKHKKAKRCRRAKRGAGR